MVDATRLAVVAPLHHLRLMRDSSRFLLCLRPSRIARQVLYGHAKSIGCHWLHVTPLKTSQRLTCGFHCPDGGTNGFVRDCAPAVSNLVGRFISPHTLTGAATGAGSFMLPDRAIIPLPSTRAFNAYRNRAVASYTRIASVIDQGQPRGVPRWLSGVPLGDDVPNGWALLDPPETRR